MTKVLIQTQLSSYNKYGLFDLATDSGWQMCINRVREMLKLAPDLHVDIMGPLRNDYGLGCEQMILDPLVLNKDVFDTKRCNYISHSIIPNALATRFDFNFDSIADALELDKHRTDASLRYDWVIINDPMHLRNFKAMFQVHAGYQPKFVVHTHFVDSPASPKFPVESSLWLGQVEAAIRSDVAFWQCQSALDEFEREVRKLLLPKVVDGIMAKSRPWDDGYSITEITSLVNMNNLRFTPEEFEAKTRDKVIIFVPNRVGGRGRSSDYTNVGHFMFNVLPGLRNLCQDFVVIAGNPNQKFSNAELEAECGPNGYINLVPGSFNRDEFKYVAKRSHIVCSLYNQDTYGGTVMRECVELGCIPLMLDNFEYSTIAREALYPFLSASDLSTLVKDVLQLIDHVKTFGRNSPHIKRLQEVICKKCSYESTTPTAMKAMGLLE